MFREASVFNQNISSWVPSSVTNMGGMFRQASAFNQDISQWKVSSVTDMNNMFNQAGVFNQDISSWDVSSVINMASMFSKSTSFDQNLSSWNIASVNNMTSIFSGITLSTANYDALLTGWSAQNLQTQDGSGNAISFNAGKSRYSSAAQAARSRLTQTFGWKLSDGGLAP